MTYSGTLDERWDTGVFLLDNVAFLAADGVHILDRRVYPFEVRWEICPTVADVARAIVDMVTQSRGPGVVAGYGMVLAARESARDEHPEARLAELAQLLVETRPTNHSVRHAVESAFAVCAGDPAGWESAVADLVVQSEQQRRAHAGAIGATGAELLADGARVLTNCWAESGFVQAIAAAVAAGRAITVYCPETRPYLQGARLTADAVRDAGAEVFVVPDNAIGYLISEGLVDLAITGSDRVTADGGVVNKIGTLAIATLCSTYGIPFYSTCNDVDTKRKTVREVTVEIRNGEEALECLGQRTATLGVAGFYPAFDRTPPELVTGLISATGILRPADLARAAA